jgi:membrane protein DedA with SNARE-associated domain
MLLSFSAIFGWLITYRYFVLFPISVVEGPIVTILAGSFASTGVMNFWVVVPLIVLGEICGDAIYYLVGRSGRGKFIERFGRYIGITRRRVEKLEVHFEKHTGKTLIISKLAHFMGGAFMTAAGMARVPYRKFLWFNFLATIPKTLILLLTGYYFGRAYVELGRGIDYVSIGALVSAIFFIVIYLLIRRKTKKAVENEVGQDFLS